MNITVEIITTQVEAEVINHYTVDLAIGTPGPKGDKGDDGAGGVSQAYVDTADAALQLEINDLQARADNIEANQTADETNISTLFGAVSTEVTNRTNADAALLQKINDLEGLALAGL
jgi:hypothetical protein